MKCPTLMDSISLIIPAFNEAPAMRTVLEEIHRFLPTVECIVIDDGSTDGTGTIAKAMGVRVLMHARRLGSGRSVKDGILAASNDTIVLMDADCTYPVERIPDIVASLERADMVVGVRQGLEHQESVAKRYARTILRGIAERLTGRHIPDVNSGLRAFRRSSMQKDIPFLCDGFSFMTTITLAYIFTGRTVQYVPVTYHRRVGISKVRFPQDAVRTLIAMMKVAYYYRRTS